VVTSLKVVPETRGEMKRSPMRRKAKDCEGRRSSRGRRLSVRGVRVGIRVEASGERSCDGGDESES